MSHLGMIYAKNAQLAFADISLKEVGATSTGGLCSSSQKSEVVDIS